MPAYLAGRAGGARSRAAGAYGLKAIVITPGNPAGGLDAHQGVVLVSDGRPACRWPC